MFLGVDGGGTKTALCLVDQDGRLVASAQAPSSYYFFDGIELVERVLRLGVATVCDQARIAPLDIRYAFFGLPGYGEVSNDLATLDAAPRSVLGHERYTCDNDMVCGWAGSLAAVDGINVISGTGSMTYGERAGRHARVGGWGEVFGDEGSAHWIGVQGLRAFAKMSDGRLPDGPLRQLLSASLQLPHDLELVDLVLNRWRADRRKIAALSRVVAEAADHGDLRAVEILAEAGAELAELVDATRRRLEFPADSPVLVSYSGGVFNAPLVLNAFGRQLTVLHDGYDLRQPLYPPVIGAAIYAAKLNGTPLADSALARLHRSLGRAAAAGPPRLAGQQG